MIYEVELPDGQSKDYSANVISYKIQTKVESDGYSFMMINAVIEYQRDESVALLKENIYIIT